MDLTITLKWRDPESDLCASGDSLYSAESRTRLSGMIVAGFLLNLCYLIVAILWSPAVLWKRLRTGKYKQGWSQKLWGQVPVPPPYSGARIWLHAVSVGEVLQLRQVIGKLKARSADLQVVVSTTTETGYAVAVDKLTDCHVIYFPLDFTWSVRAALDRIQPDLIALVELELWPNFIREAARRQIPLTLVNGRLSARSFRGYRWIRPLVSRLLNRFSLIAVQTDEYQERFLQLGAPPRKTVVTGSIKFDGVQTNRQQPKATELKHWLQLEEDAPVFIAGSTQHPEEQYALETYQELRRQFPQLRLILVPRHPERGPEIEQLVEQAGHRCLRRSQLSRNPSVTTPGPTQSGLPPVGLLDTVGELGACWALADVAFVGGSFTDRGGQNLLEPAAYGSAVCFGPNTWNFRQIVELLLEREAVCRVKTPAELTEFVRSMLSNPTAARQLGQTAQQLILEQQGATDRTVAMLLELLPQQPGQSGRLAA
ncbi:3-deoxy-D-manno-octulosonic acid transferase [Planctomicrobium sp. SH664]|uniref:3-deoxy-D-manno-octulosonic acid transferase n=1 Tax=Planctomicrobium sp. SH664 TaxID=3448125 RepID=UPI003F5C4B25